MNSIVIDCGASYIKAAYMDDEHIIEKKLYDTGRQYKFLTCEEKDRLLPERLRTIVAIVRETLRCFARGERSVQLGICNEMHGFVITDEFLIPYMDYVSWQQEYITESFSEKETWKEHLEKQLAVEDIRSTGMPFKPGLPSGNLAYLVQTGRLQQENSLFLTLGDFIYAWLFGKTIPMHPTNAAATGLYDICNGCWNQNLIQQLGLHEIQFPIVSARVQAERFWVADREVIVFPALGDQQASLLGAGLDSRQQISINMGTGAQVSVLSDLPELSTAYQTRPYFDGMYLHTVPHIPSGRAVNVFYRFVEQIVFGMVKEEVVEKTDIWNWINAEAAKSGDCSLTVDLSFFTNAVTSNTEGKIDKISETNFDVGGLFCAVYRQVTENVLMCVERIRNDGIEKNEVLMSGGMLQKNAYLRDMISSRFRGCTVRLSDSETFYGLQKYMRSVKGQI